MNLIKKKKVAIVITRLDLGGAQQVAIETAKRIDKNLFEVFLISGIGGKLDSSVKNSLGQQFVPNKFIKHSLSPFFDVLAIFSLIVFFLKENISVVHTHSSKAGVLGRVSAFMARVPVIIHTVHGWSFNDLMRPFVRKSAIFLEKILAIMTTRFICVAHSDRLKGLSLGIGDNSKYVVIRAGIDLDEWRVNRPSLNIKADLGIAPDSIIIGTIANFKIQKNPLGFVDVARMICQKFPHVHFIYVGDGPLRERCSEKLVEFGIKNRVHFLGWRNDVSSIAENFDVFILTSFFEGLPCVFPQVLSIGIPIVATNVDGASEIVIDGINGYLVPPGDMESLANKLKNLIENPQQRKIFSAAAKSSIDDGWGYTFMAAETAKEYSRL